jgi:hypothetical protein
MNKNNKYAIQQAMLSNTRGLRSGFGEQTFSTKVTEPRTVIGTSIRNAYGKVAFLNRRVSSIVGRGPPSQRRVMCTCQVGSRARHGQAIKSDDRHST